MCADRAGAQRCPTTWPPRQRLALRLADETPVVGVLAVELFRTTDGAIAGQRRARDTYIIPLDHRRGAHQPVRAASARGLGLPARRQRRRVPSDGDGQACSGAAQPPTASERLHHLFARMPDARVHLYGKAISSDPVWVGRINFPSSDVAQLL